jgi:hypothetical protein
MTTTIDSDYGGDEEKTLPPPPREPAISASLGRSSAGGDFRTYETTFAAMGDGPVVEIQLISEQGYRAHFAMDRELAARIAHDLEGQLSEPYRRERFHLLRPPKLAPFDVVETDVFFTVDEALRVTVMQETPGGDRIVLAIWSDEASLRITMQVGVAVAVWRFLALAAGRPG